MLLAAADPSSYNLFSGVVYNMHAFGLIVSANRRSDVKRILHNGLDN